MSPSLTVSHATEDEAGAEECAALIAATGADIYFTTPWRAVWWEHYGPSWARSRRPATLIVRDGHEVIAILPFCIERFWLGPVSVRLARLAGVDPNFAVVMLPVAQDRARAAFEAGLTHLTGVLGCDVVAFSPISERSPQLPALREAIAACGRVALRRDRSMRHHTLMDLPETAEAFLASLSKNRRREYRRDVKRLAERAPLETRTTSPETVAGAMDRFVALHAAQWESKGRGGHFSDWPAAEAFYRALLERLVPLNQAGLDELWSGETLLSSQLRFSWGKKAYWWLNARSVAPEFARIGLGRVGLVERVDDLLRAGIRTVDAGTGEYEYKLAYGGELVPTHDLLISGAGALARARASALMFWADTLHLLYYRLWFLKLAPRLGLAARPLWRRWIRSRF